MAQFRFIEYHQARRLLEAAEQLDKKIVYQVAALKPILKDACLDPLPRWDSSPIPLEDITDAEFLNKQFWLQVAKRKMDIGVYEDHHSETFTATQEGYAQAEAALDKAFDTNDSAQVDAAIRHIEEVVRRSRFSSQARKDYGERWKPLIEAYRQSQGGKAPPG